MPLVSGSRVHSEYSFCNAAIGCTAWARRMVAALARKARSGSPCPRRSDRHGAGHVLDRHRGVDPVLIEQIDQIDAEPLQRRVGDFLICSGWLFKPRAYRSRRCRSRIWWRSPPDRAAEQRLADQLFVGQRAVQLRGVEERHAALMGRADQRRRPAARAGWRRRSPAPCSRSQGPRPRARYCPVGAFSSATSNSPGVPVRLGLARRYLEPGINRA